GEVGRRGATWVDPADIPNVADTFAPEFTVLLYEFKADIAAYLSELRNTSMRTLADLIAFNEANPDPELRWFGQEIFVQAEATGGLDDPAYLEALATSKRLATEGIDQTLARFDLDAIVSLTNSPPWTTDLVNGDHFLTASSTPSAIARHPSITPAPARDPRLPQHPRPRRLLVRGAPGGDQLHRRPLVRADPDQAGLRVRAGHQGPARPPVPAQPRGQGLRAAGHQRPQGRCQRRRPRPHRAADPHRAVQEPAEAGRPLARAARPAADRRHLGDHGVDLVVGGVEVGTEAQAGTGAVVAGVAAGDQLLGGLLGAVEVDDHAAAPAGRVGRPADDRALGGEAL